MSRYTICVKAEGIYIKDNKVIESLQKLCCYKVAQLYPNIRLELNRYGPKIMKIPLHIRELIRKT